MRTFLNTASVTWDAALRGFSLHTGFRGRGRVMSSLTSASFSPEVLAEDTQRQGFVNHMDYIARLYGYIICLIYI